MEVSFISKCAVAVWSFGLGVYLVQFQGDEQNIPPKRICFLLLASCW